MDDAWFFDRFAWLYDSLMWTANREPVEAGFGHASVDVETVLDVAGGTGRVGRTLIPAYVVTVIDLSRPMLVEAREYGLACVQGDATRLPMPDGAVDAVVVADAYHHFPDPDAVLNDVRRILRPGGVVVVRDFDPTTVRGGAISMVERALGWPSTFRTPDELAFDMDRHGFDARVLDEGFGYTVVGRKPESDR